MTKKWKRIAALSSAVVMATATLLYFPSDTLQNISWKITASAEYVGAVTWTKTESDGLTWTLYEDGTLTISGTGAMKDYYCDNSNLGPIYDNSDVRKVVIEDGITSIGAFAFFDCYFTSITIPDSVTSIGESAFQKCSRLKTISLSCKSTLKKSDFGDQADLVSYTNQHALTKTAAKAATCTEDGNKEYWTCEHCGKYFLSDDTNPETAKAVELSETILPAIQHKNVELRNVLEPTETDPGYSGDRYCPDCDTVLEKGYTYWIEDNLTWKLYEDGTLNISGTGAMKDYNINDTQSPVINHQNVKKVMIEDGVTSIGNYAFYFCENLTSLTLPDSVTSIGDSAFDTCRGLTNITIPEGVTNIGDCAFYDCSNLTSITIPDSVTSIGNGVLEACSSLKTISISCKSTLKKNNFGSQVHLVSHIPHILTKTAAKDVTCAEDGNKEYWTCEHCGKYFLSDDTDPETATAVELSETILPAIQHKNVELRNVSEPTETAPGYSGDRYCPDCNTVLEKGYTYWIEDNLTWKLYEDGTLNISGTGAMKDYNIDGNQSPVINHQNIKKVVIEDGVTSIGDWAFYHCSSLTSIVIPNSVTSIGDSVFYGCNGLTSIIIPDDVTSIGKEAFRFCSSLTSITIPNSVTSIGNVAFSECSSLTSITLPDSVTSIGDYAFYGCNRLTSITIPDGVTSIGESAFCYCRSLTSITIPDGVTSIGKSAFSCCSNLTSITIPGGVTSIGESAFNSCRGLTSIIILDGVTSIGKKAFRLCSSLTITIPDSVTSIGTDAFELSSLKTISLSCKSSLKKSDFGEQADLVSYNHKNAITRDATEPTKTAPGYSGDRYCPDCDTVLEKGYTYWIEDNLTWKLYEDGTLNISGTGAMKDYSHSEGNQSPVFDNDTIKSVVIEDGVTSIGNFAFKSCGGLISVTIPDSVTSIGNFAFSGCEGLTNITIPNSVTCIGMKVFGGCSGLTSITIPNSVTSIDEGAFEFCSSLTSILLPDGITSIGVGAFGNCESLINITIPDGVTSIGDWAFEECSNLTSITIPSSVTNIGIRAFDGCSNLTSITIPDGVTSIGDWAFYHCNSLTNITIPGSVTNIGHSTFFGCKNLTSITILDGVTSIGMSVFSNCERLTDIIIPNSVTSIEEDAFSNCKSLTSITIPNSVTSIENFVFFGCSSLTNITIPESVTSIGTWAFKDCSNLTNITIPSSVTSIGEAAFDNCNDLTDIYYLDTKMKWKQISISEDAISPDVTIHFVEPATTVYGDVNLDGKVDILDAVFLNKYLATMVQFSDVQAANADCCQDDVLNEKDANALLQFVILLIDDLPVPPVQE